MNVYRSGQVVPLTFEVVDPVTGDLTNPTAATHSQNNFRPKNKITTPMSAPTIATEK